jgi:hypothetical protein
MPTKRWEGDIRENAGKQNNALSVQQQFSES